MRDYHPLHGCALRRRYGLPVRLALTAGEVHENQLATDLLARLKTGAMHLADRGYDADWIRALVSEHGAWANIPPQRNRKESRTQNQSRPCHQSKRS